MGYRRYKGNQEQGKKEKANHKPWNNTSQKQIADRCAGCHAIHDQRNDLRP